VPGTREHAGAASYILAELRSSGLEARIDRTASGGDNVVAEWGRPGSPLVVLGAHYDSVEESLGADDNASGVAALLEVARSFAADVERRSPGSALLKIVLLTFAAAPPAARTREQSPLGFRAVCPRQNQRTS
jgi:hypothetical protein